MSTEHHPCKVDVYVDVFTTGSEGVVILHTAHYVGTTDPADDYLRTDVVLGALAAERSMCTTGQECAVRFVEIDGVPDTAGRTALSIAREPFAWPGGYERFAITDDGGVLCWKCCTAELSIIRQSDPGDGWHVDGSSHTGETDSDVTCDHCNRVVQEAWDAAPRVTDVKLHAGIAGQFSISATVKHPNEDPRHVTFTGSVYGGPVVMSTGSAEVFVTDPSRFGTFGPGWVERFFGDAA